jgi:putative FmdB family regulatory protein
MRQSLAYGGGGIDFGADAGKDDRHKPGSGSAVGGKRCAIVHNTQGLTMPIYEYRCLDCSKRSSLLQLGRAASNPALCAHCGSNRLERLLSRFACPKSEEARMESLADDASSGFDESDPASAERMMKHMGEELGQDFSDEMAQAIESNEDASSGVDDDGGY